MLLRRVARPLLAGIFISGGINALRDPHGHEKLARPVLDQLTRAIPEDNRPPHVDLVRLDAGIKIGAGSLLALGKMPRLAAIALSASLIPTTAAQHRFWELDDPDRRQAEQIHFLKNMGLLGGLLLAAADTGGKPSLFWRARHRRPHLTVEPVADRVGAAVGTAGARVTGTAGRLGAQAGRAGERAVEAAERARGTTRKATKKAAKRARKRVSRRAARASRRAERTAASLRSRLGR
jgi:uncharacterized membrane protein YphA (DoxX/SURF4 family)